MSDWNLPIKVVIPRSNDTVKNPPGGKIVFFGEVTNDLKRKIEEKFVNVLEYYDDVFKENAKMPAVGKITVKKEAIAKSYTPKDLCRYLPIIGSEELDEVYIKLTKSGIKKTIDIVNNPTSEKIKANLTTISNIEPITINDKISESLKNSSKKENKDKKDIEIKVKLFDFGDEFDNMLIEEYFYRKISEIGLNENTMKIIYGEKIKLLKMKVNKSEDIIKIASINGVKSLDLIQEYCIPVNQQNEPNSSNTDFEIGNDFVEGKTIIGIIDGGISQENKFLSPYIYKRVEYVAEEYQNSHHATFIASTINYGNILNGIDENSIKKRYNFLDIVAIPNGNIQAGPTDTIDEFKLMEIINEVMNKYSNEVKIWNISLALANTLCNDSISDLGTFLDYIQDKYNVQIFVPTGNLEFNELRHWPVLSNYKADDRLTSPGDSIRSITVGSVALYDSKISLVKKNEPSPFSRRGPGANYSIKPEICDYGGNISQKNSITGLGIKGFDKSGSIVEDVGTSYSTPRAVYKYANIYDELIEQDLLLSKAMLIHSARIASKEDGKEKNAEIHYRGFGMPLSDNNKILKCAKNEVTLIFKQKIVQGSHLEMFDFPFPPKLIRNGKYFGEITMTLAYNPPLDKKFGKEYCRANIDASFGTYRQNVDGTLKYEGQVPVEARWDQKNESYRIRNGFKWSPIKSYYRNLKNGIEVKDGWKIRIDLTPRGTEEILNQEFVLIITIKDKKNNDIYTDIVNGLRISGFVVNDLEIKQSIRERTKL